MTHNAETVADDGPRWTHDDQHVVFLARVGPIDLWLDYADLTQPFLAVFLYRANTPKALWAANAMRIIERAKAKRVHLTLHDECMIHALCEPHNRRLERKLQNLMGDLL